MVCFSHPPGGQSSSRPNSVQCTEGVYLEVFNDPSCPVLWEDPHTVQAKGFGEVSAYFMRATTRLPPQDLVQELGLQTLPIAFAFDTASSRLAPALNPLSPASRHQGLPTSAGSFNGLNGEISGRGTLSSLAFCAVMPVSPAVVPSS